MKMFSSLYQFCVMKIDQFCLFPHRFFLLLGVSFLVILPSIFLGFFADDFVHRNIIYCDLKPFDAGDCKKQLANVWHSINQLFNFHDHKNQTIREGIQTGFMPWWTNPDLHWSMGRPLAGLFHWLDYALWPDQPVLMHLHSGLWFLLLVLVLIKTVTRLARDIGYQDASRMMWLGSLIFVLDCSHYEAIYWLAARNMMIASVFFWVTLYFYHRWSIEKNPIFFIAGFFSFLGALLSAEMGVVTLIVLVLYVFTFSDKPFTKHCIGLFIYFILFLLWKKLYISLGFGNSGGQLYVDPVTDPVGFFKQMWQLFPIYFFAQFSAIDGFSLLLNKTGLFFYWLLCVGLMFSVLFRIRKLLKRNLWALFCCLGFMACVVPICALPTERGRLLFSASAFGAYFLAIIVIEAMKKFESTKKNIYQYVVVSILCIHVGLSALFGVGVSVGVFSGQLSHSHLYHFQFEEGIKINKNHSLVVINEPFYFEKIYWNMHANWYRDIVPKNLFSFFDGLSPLQVLRKNHNTFVVESAYGLQAGRSNYLLNAFPIGSVHYFEKMDRHFVGGEQIFFVGMSFLVRDIIITVEAVNEFHRPTRVRFEFTQGLTPDQLWLFWDWVKMEYQLFKLPEINGSVIIGGPFMDATLSMNRE